MKGRRHAVILFVVAVLVVVGSCKKQSAPSLPIVGNKAPLFVLKDVQGKTVNLSDFSGKVVVLDFWATWCGPCKESTRELEALYERYREKGVVFLGISMDEGSDAVGKVIRYTEDNGLSYLMLMDDGRASEAYHVNKVPMTYILDREHTIAAIYPGYQPGLGDMIARQLDGLLKGVRDNLSETPH